MPRQAGSPVASGLSLAGDASLGGRLLDRLLAAYGSPLQGHGQEIAALSARYRIDDAVALGFFVMESRLGTLGEAVLTRSVGNLRPMPHAAELDGYRRYQRWMDGVTEWFQVMRGLYLDQLGLTTVEAVAPIYAPATDSNDPSTMIAGIHQLVACWHGAADRCPADPPGMAALVGERMGHATISRSNTCLDSLAKRKRRPQTSPLAADGDEGGEEIYADQQSATPEDAALQRELRHCIERTLAAVGAIERAMIVLRDVEGRSYQEIAEILSLGLSAVKMRIHRARLAFGQLLQTICPETWRTRMAPEATQVEARG